MRRLLIFSVFALVGTGFWLLNHEGRKATILPAHSSEQSQGILTVPETINPPMDYVDYKVSVIPATEFPSITMEDFTFPLALFETKKLPELQSDFHKWTQEPEFRKVKNIDPPIEGVNPPSTAVLVQPNIIHNGGIIQLGFDAFLHLPAAALVDEFGQEIEEPVKISYCPLSDPIDVFLSGVPMKYDSAGSSETFRTAGMVRLEASTYSGKQVSLKSGTSMRLDMPTVDGSDDYNFYDFDEQQGAWKFSSTAPPARPLSDIIIDTVDFVYKFDTQYFN